MAALALAALAFAAPVATADGWRAAFLLLSAPPIGAVALLLVARVVGADWDAALVPLLPFIPWLAVLAVPVAIGQALFHWPAGHLHFWLSPPLFVARSALALLFWAWSARRLRRGAALPAGPLLLAHGVVVSVMGYDWLLGASPAQPQSAAPLVLGVMQLGGATGLACAAGLGTPAQRRDLAYLLVACALGFAYLLYMDFVIVWFGDLPAHVGWYDARRHAPAALLPGLALSSGLAAPVLLVGVARDDRARRIAGAAALVGLGLAIDWFVAGPAGWVGLLAALLGVLAAGGLARAVST